MNCPPGTIGTLEGATHDNDGCTLVVAGEYSAGGVVCEATPLECPQGQYGTKIGAVDATDGCVNCGLG